MRSEIVLATLHTKNRFELCHQVFKVVRKLHKPGNRVQDTTNEVIQRLAAAEEKKGASEDATAVENKQEQSAIDSHAGAASAEPL